MERENDRHWTVTREDLHRLRTRLTVAMLAMGQLTRTCARTVENKQLARYLTQALKQLRTHVDEIDRRKES